MKYKRTIIRRQEVHQMSQLQEGLESNKLINKSVEGASEKLSSEMGIERDLRGELDK